MRSIASTDISSTSSGAALQRTTERNLFVRHLRAILDWKRNRDSTSKGTDGQLDPVAMLRLFAYHRHVLRHVPRSKRESVA